MNDRDRYLPGDPSKLLIRKVRRQLKSFGIVPLDKFWRLAWAWAREVADSYRRSFVLAGLAKEARCPRWPSPCEIASQYLLLLLADMRNSGEIKLPYRAAEHVPPAVAALFGPQRPMLPAATTELPVAPTDLFTAGGVIGGENP
jgi:hypothetical protein